MTSSGMASSSRAHRFPSSSLFGSLQAITRQLESDESPRGLGLFVSSHDGQCKMQNPPGIELLRPVLTSKIFNLD
jgi:hypothetical protein